MEEETVKLIMENAELKRSVKELTEEIGRITKERNYWHKEFFELNERLNGRGAVSCL